MSAEVESADEMAVPELKPIEGKYEILEKLNEGGMGAVYKVQHRLLEEIRVIKVIRPQLQSDENLRRRFLREARAAVRLRHPNIAELYDFTVAEDGTAYMVIEFIDGVDLVHLIQQSALPSIRLVLDIGIQSLRALAYLHRKQFVHRDISPDNLMLTKDVEGRALVKLIDMGIAKPLQSEINLTGEGLFLGKVRYASPEQFGGQSGKDEIDHRSDLYSFGIVLYELLTGVHPITGEDNQTILAGHLFHPPRSFEETDPENHVPEALREIVLTALEKMAADRFLDADEFSNRLAGLGAQWQKADERAADLDATAIQPKPGAVGRSGSTQDYLDLEFAPGQTPVPRTLEAVPPSDEDLQESLLQSCCDKVESLIENKRLLEAEVELHRGEKTLGHSILLQELSQRIKKLREEVNESLVRATLLLRDGDFEAALEQISEAKTLDSDNPEVVSLFGEISKALDRRNREIDTARSAIEAHLEAGQLERAHQDLGEAQETFGRFAHFESLQERVDGLLEAAEEVRRIASAAGSVRQLIDSGKLQQAAAALIAARRTHGDDEMFAALAEQLESLEEREQEKERLAKEAARRQQINSHLEAAQHHSEAENYAAALDQIDLAAALDPESPQIQAAHRRTQDALERHDQSRRRAERVEKLTAEVESLLESGDIDAAENKIAAGEASQGELHELASLRVRVDEARLERREKAAGELLKKAYRFFETGNLEGAADCADQALTLSPGLPQATKLHQKIVERGREDVRLQALESARGAILDHLNAGSLDQAAQALKTATHELGVSRELKDLEKRLQDLRARDKRRLEIGKSAQRIDKLIQKKRLDKASSALAEAVRSLGQDAVFDELRTRVEDQAGREQAAQEILAAEIGQKPTSTRSRSIWYVAAALLVIVVGVVIYSTRSSPETRGDGQQTTAEPLAEPAETLDQILAGQEVGSFHALVVGNNSYLQGLPDLDTAVKDAQQLASILDARYGFQTELLLNATRYQTLSALESYISRLRSGDNFLVFYAGHGFVDEVTGRGYWQPTDAEPDNTANWISSLEVSDVLLDMPARRVLVVADSCFSGAFAEPEMASMMQTTSPSSRQEILERLDLRTRRVLSSGSLQPVMDNGANGHSVFSRALLAVLDDSPGAMESSELFETVREKVTAATIGMELQQQPQFGPLDSDSGGLFLFVPTDKGES